MRVATPPGCWVVEVAGGGGRDELACGCRGRIADRNEHDHEASEHPTSCDTHCGRRCDLGIRWFRWGCIRCYRWPSVSSTSSAVSVSGRRHSLVGPLIGSRRERRDSFRGHLHAIRRWRLRAPVVRGCFGSRLVVSRDLPKYESHGDDLPLRVLLGRHLALSGERIEICLSWWRQRQSRCCSSGMRRSGTRELAQFDNGEYRYGSLGRHRPVPPPQRRRAVRQQVERMSGGGHPVRQAGPRLQRHLDRHSDHDLAPRSRQRAVRHALVLGGSGGAGRHGDGAADEWTDGNRRATEPHGLIPISSGL